MVDINKITTFLRAAETLSFSESAKQLHMSQPSVSHHIKMLEQEMGTALFTTDMPVMKYTNALLALDPATGTYAWVFDGSDVGITGDVDAALAASVFHYRTHGIRETKVYLRERGIPVRM